MKLIGLTGLPRSGKNTVADYLQDNYGFGQMAWATTLKQAAAVLLKRPVIDMNSGDREAVMPEWGFSIREFLQKVGTEVCRNIDPDFWVKRLAMEYDAYPQSNIVITDTRFPNEAAWIRSRGGIIVEIVRPGTVKSSHASDQGIPADKVIHNTGTIEDLHDSVDAMAEDFIDLGTWI
jgi:hypothetical protein